MVELETDGRMSRDDVATFLREFADELQGESTRGRRDADTTTRTDADATGSDREGGERHHDARQITFIVGGESATVTVPETVSFDAGVESRSPLLTSGVNQEIEFELSWEIDEPGKEDDDIDLV